MKTFCVLFVSLICFGCKPKLQQTDIKISLTKDRHVLRITGLDYSIIQDINRDSVNSAWQSLVPVFRMPADTDLKDFQPLQPGKYVVNGRAILFTPDTPFAKQQTYFVRYYKHDSNNSQWDYIKQHKKLGEIPYTDLIFKQ